MHASEWKKTVWSLGVNHDSGEYYVSKMAEMHIFYILNKRSFVYGRIACIVNYSNQLLQIIQSSFSRWFEHKNAKKIEPNYSVIYTFRAIKHMKWNQIFFKQMFFAFYVPKTSFVASQTAKHSTKRRICRWSKTIKICTKSLANQLLIS